MLREADNLFYTEVHRLDAALHKKVTCPYSESDALGCRGNSYILLRSQNVLAGAQPKHNASQSSGSTTCIYFCKKKNGAHMKHSV